MGRWNMFPTGIVVYKLCVLLFVLSCRIYSIDVLNLKGVLSNELYT